jgi:hypothetical protein
MREEVTVVELLVARCALVDVAKEEVVATLVCAHCDPLPRDVGEAVASILRSGAMARTAADDLRQVGQRDLARPRTSWIDDMVLVLASGWVITGMVLDAWAHTHQRLESFFTPWHGVLYSGFVVLMAWMAWISLRARLLHRAGGALPVGYGVGMVGVGLSW